MTGVVLDDMRQLIGGAVRRIVAVAAVAVIGHDLLYAAAYGAGADAARRATGHGPYWAWTWVLVIAAAVALAAVSLAAVFGLLRRLERADRPRFIPAAPYRREVLRLWPRLALAATLVFVGQEYAEHYVSHHGHLLAPWSFLSGEFALTVPSFGLVALLVASVAACFARTRAVLEATVRRLAERMPRPPRRTTRPVWHEAPPRLLGTLATPDLGRAPPA